MNESEIFEHDFEVLREVDRAERNIYDNAYLEEFTENDEITAGEEAFMFGYNQ